MSRGPACPTIASTSGALVTSARVNEAVPPRSAISSTVWLPVASSTSFTTTAAPSRARRRAITWPIPEPAPVTIAVLPATSMAWLRLARGFAVLLNSQPGREHRSLRAHGRCDAVEPDRAVGDVDERGLDSALPKVGLVPERGAAAVAQIVRPPGLVGQRARPGFERI